MRTTTNRKRVKYWNGVWYLNSKGDLELYLNLNAGYLKLTDADSHKLTCLGELDGHLTYLVTLRKIIYTPNILTKLKLVSIYELDLNATTIGILECLY